MGGLTLYKLADEYLAVAEKLSDLELDAQTIADTLEGMAGELEVKATNVAMFTKGLEAMAASIKKAEDDMAARRKAIENRATRIREYLRTQMERTGISKIDGPYVSIALRNTPPKVEIDCEAEIPAAFWRQPETPPAEPDKRLILDVLNEGGTVPGAHLSKSKRVEIK